MVVFNPLPHSDNVWKSNLRNFCRRSLDHLAPSWEQDGRIGKSRHKKAMAPQYLWSINIHGGFLKWGGVPLNNLVYSRIFYEPSSHWGSMESPHITKDAQGYHL